MTSTPIIEDRRSADRGDGSDRRRQPRLRVLLAATLGTPSGDRAVRLRNLSQTGALIEVDPQPPIGTPVVFKRGKTVAPATVVRALPGSIGIQFDEPIRESEVLVHIGKPAPRG